MSEKHFSTRVTVQNKDGIHARPSVRIVEIANNFQSDIYIQKGDLKINGKSILDLLTLAASYGTLLTVEAFGDDAKEAVQAVSSFLSQEYNFPT